MTEALHEIRQARLFDDDIALTESITDFRKRYIEREGSSRVGGAPSTVRLSKDNFIQQWASDVERFEKGTYLDGFSDVAGDVDIGNDAQDRPPPRAFLWQFMLWDIRRRKRRRRVAMVFGFILPALMLLASFAISPFLIWIVSVYTVDATPIDTIQLT